MSSFEKFLVAEQAGTYIATAPLTENDIFEMARQLGLKRLAKGEPIISSHSAYTYLQAVLATCEREVFAVVLLDCQNQVISFNELFYGTINCASVHPREVVKLVLSHNAAGVILVHNHPSGCPEPSEADIKLTKRLKSALSLIDVTTLDHIIVGAKYCVSLMEQGCM